ncbi:hypothetical protein [Acidovorax sp. A1169]|uniref:hypothetical protein n=1 Tax=Acidovorax sp. A1169 TaxID=3059524 RepID=UPI0027379A0A|nr:hypothetical protein [Acidovorax sp. A1169]MDP4074319.1 hypothetical protein [Acidovorax sp. A1169]
MKLGLCKLCLREGLLQKSHIFPKSVAKPLRGAKGHLLEVHGRGRYGVEPRQDGLKEELLCTECEAFCNTNYEVPFRDTWKKLRPVEPWVPGTMIQAKVDYSTFKLFHLLNLFRAGISQLVELRGVQLGPHEAVLRRMILEGDPGETQQYAVAGLILFDKRDGSLMHFNGYPKRDIRDRRTSYSMIYLHTEWIVLISKGGADMVRRLALQQDGALMLIGHPWQEHPILAEMASRTVGKAELPPP